MSEREIIRACIDEDGQLDVTVARFWPEDKASRLANEVAESILRLLGENVLKEMSGGSPVRPTSH
jgi:hypothetical protein